LATDADDSVAVMIAEVPGEVFLPHRESGVLAVRPARDLGKRKADFGDANQSWIFFFGGFRHWLRDLHDYGIVPRMRSITHFSKLLCLGSQHLNHDHSFSAPPLPPHWKECPNVYRQSNRPKNKNAETNPIPKTNTNNPLNTDVARA